jgi:hypothetical protein
MKTLLLTVCVIAFTATIAGASGSLVVGAPATGPNGFCYPFGCQYAAEYQQVYDSSLFTSAGTIGITQLSFYNTVYNNSSTSMSTETFVISLSTTSATHSTLSATYASNIGADNKQVFSGSLAQAWAFGNTLTITLATPFTYNPNNGNLLLDVVGSGVAGAGNAIYFDQNTTGSVPTRQVYCVSGSTCASGTVAASGNGLVTGFNYGPVSAPVSAPAASTLSLILIGLGLSLTTAYQTRQRMTV